MASDDDDLFGDSSEGDTDDLIAEASEKPVAKPKRLQKKSAPKKRKRDSIPDADNDDSDDDDDDGPGLFDDSDDDDDEPAAPPKKLSKRDRMEALARAKRRSDHGEPSMKEASTAEGQEEKGYDSGDSYNSADFVRTKEDNDFIDADDDDPNALEELYAEQHFDDERPMDWEKDEKKKKKKGSGGKNRGPDALSDEEGEEEMNPIMAAVHKMKKKKRAQKKLSDLEEEAKEFLSQMERAADEDDLAIRERRPATRKLAMLPQVLDMLARRDMMRLLLDFEVLAVCKRWIQPLPNGSLGNVTVRQKLLDAISKMTGDYGVTPNDLKRSEFGKVVMALYMHKSETPAMKRQHKKLIEQWSRPIFQRSSNMRDLEHVQANRARQGLTAVAAAARSQSSESASRSDERDLQDIIATGNKGASKESSNRVRVPFSKGFQYSVRPQGRTGDVMDKRMVLGGASKDCTRGNLSKRMTEKGRAASKNQRSANMSIEGRPAK